VATFFLVDYPEWVTLFYCPRLSTRYNPDVETTVTKFPVRSSSKSLCQSISFPNQAVPINNGVANNCFFFFFFFFFFSFKRNLLVDSSVKKIKGNNFVFSLLLPLYFFREFRPIAKLISARILIR
jgi:hypothetical protein